MAFRKNRKTDAQSQESYIPASSKQVGGRHSRDAHSASVNPAVQMAYSGKSKKRGTRASSTQLDPAYVGASSVNSNNYSRYSTDYSDRRVSMPRSKKVLLTLLIIILAAGVAALGVYVYKEYQKDRLNQDLHGGMSHDELLAIDAELTGTTHFDEPFTVLLLGSDARSDDPSIGARTDTIILARIDPTTNNITLLSIPRDTRVNIPGVGYDKFNAAYAYGGAKGTIAAVKELCGVEIDHYAEIDFEGLVGLIDAIGGIDVEVEETIDDPDAGSIVIPAGEQHLDGAAALVFSRSRAYADGDYTRVSNQRKVIEAIIHRGLEAPASDLYGLIRQSVSFLTTDRTMNIDFIFSLADQIRHNNDYPLTITTATLPSYPQMIGGVAYVIGDPQGIEDIIKIFMKNGDVAAFMEKYTVPSTAGSGDTSGYSSGYSTGYDSGYNYNYGYGSETDNYSSPGSGYDYSTNNGTTIGTDAGIDAGSGSGSFDGSVAGGSEI